MTEHLLNKYDIKRSVYKHLIHIARYATNLKAASELSANMYEADAKTENAQSIVNHAANSFISLVSLAADIVNQHSNKSKKRSTNE